MTNAATLSRARTPVLTLVAVLLALVAFPSTALAHTEFESSSPAEGETVVGPIDTVTLNFTNPAEVAGDGFQLLDPNGVVREPTAVDTTGGTSFIATFDPALTAGVYGFRWEVRAGDSHPIEGAFQFTITAPAGTTTTTPTPTTPTTPTTTTTTTSTPVGAVVPSSSNATTTTTPTTPTTEATTATTIAAATEAPVDETTLDAFLNERNETNQWPGRIGRALSIGSTIFAAGVIVALLAFVRGRRDELGALIGWVRLAGLVMLAGGVTELAAMNEAQSSAFTDLITTKPGEAALFRIIAGILVLVGFGERSGSLEPARLRPLSAAVATDRSGRLAEASDTELGDVKWVPQLGATAGLLGLALVVVSFSFDGHTVSRGPWVVHGLLNLVHVAAAAVWGGGVFAMGLMAFLRRRRKAPVGLTAMVVRFSSIATSSLAAIIIAGIVMTWLVLDSPGDLVSSDWGRILIAKVTFVGIAAAMGGYNHFVLRPGLESRPDDPVVLSHLRRSLAVESGALAVIIVLTAVLVGSAT